MKKSVITTASLSMNLYRCDGNQQHSIVWIMFSDELYNHLHLYPDTTDMNMMVSTTAEPITASVATYTTSTLTTTDTTAPTALTADTTAASTPVSPSTCTVKLVGNTHELIYLQY